MVCTVGSPGEAYIHSTQFGITALCGQRMMMQSRLCLPGGSDLSLGRFACSGLTHTSSNAPRASVRSQNYRQCCPLLPFHLVQYSTPEPTISRPPAGTNAARRRSTPKHAQHNAVPQRHSVLNSGGRGLGSAASFATVTTCALLRWLRDSRTLFWRIVSMVPRPGPRGIAFRNSGARHLNRAFPLAASLSGFRLCTGMGPFRFESEGVPPLGFPGCAAVSGALPIANEVQTKHTITAQVTDRGDLVVSNSW